MDEWLIHVSRSLGGIRCERFELAPCRLPQWRVSLDEPKDLKAPPVIPEGAEWKHWPVNEQRSPAQSELVSVLALLDGSGMAS